MSQGSEVHSSKRRLQTNSSRKARKSKRSLLLSKKTQWQARIWAAARVRLQFTSHLPLLSRPIAIKVTKTTMNTAHNPKDSRATSPAPRIKENDLRTWIGRKARKMQTEIVVRTHRAKSEGRGSTSSHFSAKEGKRTHRTVKAI